MPALGLPEDEEARIRALREMAEGLEVSAVPTNAEAEAPEGLAALAPASSRVAVARGAPQAPEAAADPYGDALAETERRRFSHTGSDFGRGIIKAFTGVSDDSGRADREAFEHAPIAEFLQRQKMADEKRRLDLTAQKAIPAAAKAAKSPDPDSPASRRIQAIITSTLGDQYTPEEIAQMSEADADSILKYGSMKRGAEVQRESEVGRQKRFTSQQLQQARIHAENLGYKWADMDQEERLAWARISEAQSARESAATSKKEEQIAGATERLGGEMDKVGAAKFTSQYEEAKKILAKHPKDVPGFGRIDGRLADEAISPEGRQLRFLVGQLLSEYRKGQTGAGMSESEREEYGRITGLVQSANDAGVKQGIDTLKRALDARVAGIEAGFRPEAVKTYRERTQPAKATTKPSTPAPPPAAPPEPRRKKDKQGRIWEEQPDGTARLVTNG